MVLLLLLFGVERRWNLEFGSGYLNLISSTNSRTESMKFGECDKCIRENERVKKLFTASLQLLCGYELIILI